MNALAAMGGARRHQCDSFAKPDDDSARVVGGAGEEKNGSWPSGSHGASLPTPSTRATQPVVAFTAVACIQASVSLLAGFCQDASSYLAGCFVRCPMPMLSQ